MTTPYQININFTGDSKNAVAAAKSLGSELNRLNQKVAASAKGNQGLYTTQQGLATQEVLLANAWKQGSHVIDRRYLSSVRGLREGLYRLRQEAQRTLIVHQGMITTLSDPRMGNAVKHLERNFTFRALDNMSTKVLNLGKNAQWTGRQLMVGVTAPLMAIGAFSLTNALGVMDIERELKRVFEGTDAQFKELNRHATELSELWGVNVEEIKKLQVAFAQTGFGESKIKSLSAATQEFATVGDVATETAQLLVQTLALQGVDGDALTETLAKLDVISDETSVSMEELAEGLPKVANLFKSYGGTVEQAAAMLVAFKDNAIPVSEGANALKSSLQRIGPAMAELTGMTGLSVNRLGQLKETIASVSELTGIDLDLLTDDGKIRGTIDTFVQVAGAYRELQKTGQGQLANKSFMAELFGQRQGERGIALISQIADSLDEAGVGATGFARALGIAEAEGDALNSVLAKYERQTQVTQNDPALKLKRTWQELRNAAIEFGKSEVLPVAQKILDVITGIIDKFDGLSPTLKKVVGGLLLGAAVLGPIIFAAGQFMIAFGALAKGAIAPFKAWYGTNQRVIESFEGASDAAQKLHGIASEFAETGDQSKFVSSAQGVIDSLRGQAVSAEDAGKAQRMLRNEILATGDAMTDMHQLIAKKTLLASMPMVSPVLRTPDFEKRTDAFGNKSDSPDMIAAREATRERLTKERLADLMNRDSSAREMSFIQDSEEARANKVMAEIEMLDHKLTEWDEQDIKAIAQSMTENTMLDKGEVRQAFTIAKRNVEEMRARIQGFEAKWGVPLPISPNANIQDDGLRFNDFVKRLTFFEEGLESQLTQIQTTMHQAEVGKYFGPAKPDVPLLPLDEIAKRVAQVPDELYQVMREAIHGSDELMKLEEGKQLLKLFGLNPAKVDQAADNLIQYAARMSGGDDFASVIDAVAHGGITGMPARGGTKGNQGVRAAAADLSRAAKSAQSKHGGTQLLTGRMMRELMNNLRFGPDQEKSRAVEDGLWQQIERAFNAEDTEAHVRALKAGEIDEDSKKLVIDFVKQTRRSVTGESNILKGARKTAARGMVSKVKDKFTAQYGKTSELADVLRSYAEQGDEEARANAGILEKSLVELQSAAAMLEDQVRKGFEPEKKYMDQFQAAFGRIERVKRNIREKGSYDDKTLLGLLKKKGFTSDFEFGGMDTTASLEARRNAGKAAWEEEFHKNYEPLFEKAAEEAMGTPVTEAELAEIKKVRKKLEKQRSKALQGAEIPPKDLARIDEAAREIVLLRRLKDLEIPEKDLKEIRKKATLAADRAVKALNEGKAIRAGGHRMPSLRSAMAQRRTTAIDSALKAVGLHPETTTVAGEAIVSEIYSVLDNPKLKEVLDAPSKEMLYGKTARQQEEVRDGFKDLRKKVIEANQIAMRTEHESWIKELIRISIDSTGNLDQGMLVRNAQERGIPKPIKDALVASVFGGMEMGSLGGSGRTKEGAMGYAGLLKEQFGKDYGFQNEALLLVNTLAEDLVSNQTFGDAGDIKRFRDLATTIMRRSAEANPDLYVGAINSIGVPLKKGTQEELDLDRSMILENTRNKMVGMNKELKSIRSKLLALYKERKALQKGFDSTRAAVLGGIADIEDQKFNAAKAAGMSEGDATALVRDLRSKKDVLESLIGQLDLASGRSTFIDAEGDIFRKWMKDSPESQNTSGRQMEMKNMLNRLTSKFGIELTPLQLEQSLEKQLHIVFKRMEGFQTQLKKEARGIKKRFREAGLQSGHMTMAPVNEVLKQAEDELADIRRRLDGDSVGYRNGLNALLAEWDKILKRRKELSTDLSGKVRVVEDSDGNSQIVHDVDGLLFKLEQEEAKGENASKREIARLKGMIERRRAKIADADAEIADVKARMDDLRRKMYSGKSAPAAALIEFAALDQMHIEEMEHLDNIRAHTDKKTDELTVVIQGVKGRMQSLTVKRDNLNNLQMSLLKLIHSKTGAIGDDMQALDAVVGPVGRGAKGKFVAPALENIIGGLSPEMSKSMYEMLVRQIEGTVKGVDQDPILDEAIRQMKELDLKTEADLKRLFMAADELGVDVTMFKADKKGQIARDPEELRKILLASLHRNLGEVEEDIEQAAEIVRAYNPDMPDDLVREFARKGILLGRIVRQDMTKAEAIFGKHFIDEVQSFARGQGMFAAGMPGLLNTMDRLYDGEAILANARDRDIIFNSDIMGDPDDDVNESSRKSQGGSARESREHNQALDLITGFKHGEIEAKQQGLIDLDNAMTTLDRQILVLEKQERDAIKKNGHARSQATKKHLQDLQAQRAAMNAERQKAMDGLNKLKTTKFAVVGDDGHTEIFDDYDAYVATRRAQAEELISGITSGQLDVIAKEEQAALVKAMEEDLARQQRADNKLAKIQAKQAAERVEANIRDAQTVGGRVKRMLLGKAASTGIGPTDSAILAVMHANDVAAGKAMQMYTKSEIANYREFQQKQAAMANWIAAMTGSASPMPLPAGDQSAAMAAMAGGQFVPVPKKSRKEEKAERKAQKRQNRGRGFGTHMMVDAAMDAVMWGNMGQGIDGATQNLTGFKGQLAKVSGIMRDNPMFIGLFPMMTGQITQVIESTSKWKFALLPIIGAIALIAANWKDIGPQLKGSLADLKDIANDLIDTIVMPFEEMFGMSRDIADQGNRTSSSWVNMGKAINGVLQMIIVPLRVVTSVIKATTPFWMGLGTLIKTAVNAFTALPTPIQNVITGFIALWAAVRFGVFTKLAAEGTKLRGALVKLKAAVVALTTNWKATAASAKTFISSLSLMKVGAVAAVAGLFLVINALGKYTQASREGERAAQEFIDKVAEQEQLGKHQTFDDTEDAYAKYAKEYNGMLKAYEEAQKKASGGNLKELGQNLKNPIGTLFGDGGEISKAEKETKRLAGELNRLLGEMGVTETQFNNMTEFFKKIRDEFGLTEAQARRFLGTMEGDHIDIRIDPNDSVGQFREAWSEAGDEINNEVLTPEVDTTKVDEATSKINDFISTFRDQMRSVVDGWKEASMDAFEDWADSQVEAIDAKIEALDKQAKAEEKHQQDMDYLQRREDLRNKRRSAGIRHTADRDLAIYEGRYDDAKQLDYDYGQTLAELQREESEIEEDRARTLADRRREASRERLEIEKEELQKTLDKRRENLQAQLDAMTEFIPKNVAEAQRMHESIAAKMSEFTNGYGKIGEDQAAKWGAGWGTAMSKAKDVIADEAHWAGEEAMKAFATALGVDPASLKQPEGSAAPNSASSGASRPGERPYEHGAVGSDKGVTKHSGGTIGNTSMAPADVPATLQTGEYVIRRSAVAKLGTGYLDKVNRGVAPENVYHKGGSVAGIAKSALSNKFTQAKDNFMNNGGAIGGFTAEQIKQAYQSAMGGYSGGGFSGGSMDTKGKSIDYIVDNLVKGTHPGFKARVAAWNREMGNKFNIEAGYRSMASQRRLRNRWLARVPGQALAAEPGKSMHNFGLAIDLSPSRTTAAQRAAGAKYGLRWPMGFEPWHVEPVEARAWRDQILNGHMPAGEGGVPSGVAAPTNFQLNSDFAARLAGAGGGVPAGTVTGGKEEIKAIVRSMLPRFGWGEDQWPSLDRLVQGESSWDPKADNPSSSAAGLFQKMTSVHGPVEPTVEGQANWGLDYIKDRYGSPSSAYAKWMSRNPHWYHGGGVVGGTPKFKMPKFHDGNYEIKRTGLAEVAKGERIRYADQEAGGGDFNLNLHFDGGYFGSDRELEKLVETIERKIIPKLDRKAGMKTRSFSKTVK